MAPPQSRARAHYEGFARSQTGSGGTGHVSPPRRQHGYGPYGTTRVAKVVHPRGTGDRNLTNADIRDKYAKLTRRIISTDRQAAIEKAVLGLDTLGDVAELAALLTPVVHSPLD